MATDDERIFEAVRALGAEAAMTSPDHASGTGTRRRSRHRDAIIRSSSTSRATSLSSKGRCSTGWPGSPPGSGPAHGQHLMARVTDMSVFADPHRVKVVVDASGNALLFFEGARSRGRVGFFLSACRDLRLSTGLPPRLPEPPGLAARTDGTTGTAPRPGKRIRDPDGGNPAADLERGHSRRYNESRNIPEKVGPL